ncbi:MAG TPA: M56 family metallopeptidase, partial [Gemmataceae bacterium]|nr:M56 family metallopeptidase [Gemmataceae bacterium]
PASVESTPTVEAGWSPSWESVLLGVWVAGALVSVVVATKRVRRFGKLLAFGTPAPAALTADVEALAARMGLRRAPRVRVVPGGIAPLVWAVGRPTLFFPAALLPRLSHEQRLTLLAHELAHLRRWDHVVRAVEFVAVAVYWWCPLAWVARRELRRLEEEACDAEVTAGVPDSGYAYASAIVETIDYVAGVPVAPKFASAIGDAPSLRRRLVSILEGRNSPRTSARARWLLILGGAALLAVGPRLDRLSAAEKSLPPIEDATKFTTRSALVPRPGDEAFAEFAQFLPTPPPLLSPADLGTELVSGAAMSPDGCRLAVAAGASVRVFDIATKRLLFTLSGHAGSVNAVAFSPDGSRLATAGNDGTAKLWHATDGRLLHTLLGHTEWVMTIAFSPSGRTLATGGYDKTVRLWDAASGSNIATLTGHAGGVRTVAFSPDGRTLATGGADNTVQLWTVTGGRSFLTLKKHKASVRAVAFSLDGSLVASASEDRTVRISQITDGREVGSPAVLHEEATALAFSPRGDSVFAGSSGGHLVQMNPTTGRIRAYLGVEPGRQADSPTHADAVTGIFPTPDGRTLITISQERTAFVWTAGEADTPRQAYRGSHRTTAVAVSADGAILATGGHDGGVRLWDAATGAELLSIPAHTGGVTALAFGAGGRLVSAGADERVRVWDAKSGAALMSMIQPTEELHIAVSPDGTTLAIGGRNMPGVSLVNLTSPGKPRRVGGSVGDVTAVAFAPSDDRLATGYSCGMVRFWDAATGRELVRSSPKNGSVDGIAFTPDGATAVVVVNAEMGAESESGPVHEAVFVDTRTGLVRAGKLPHPGPVTTATVTRDGRILTASHDGNLYVWDAGRAVRVVRGHADQVRGVALAADGSAVYSACDRAAKRWPLADAGANK